MNKITIEIDKESVLESVKNIAAYIGAKSVDATGNAAYDKVAIFEEDATVVNDIWSLSCNELIRLFGRYVTSSSCSTTSMSVELHVPNNALDSAQELLALNSRSFLVYCILSKWCDIAKQEDAKIYEEDIQVAASTIKETLYGRKTYSRTEIMDTWRQE